MQSCIDKYAWLSKVEVNRVLEWGCYENDRTEIKRFSLCMSLLSIELRLSAQESSLLTITPQDLDTAWAND